jgi:hypothetical protein
MSSFLVKVAKAFIRPAAHPVRRNEFSSNPPTINSLQLPGNRSKKFTRYLYGTYLDNIPYRTY